MVKLVVTGRGVRVQYSETSGPGAQLTRPAGYSDPTETPASPAGVSVPGPAPPPPALDPAAPPLTILVVYDGTIAQTDVPDALMADFVTEEWEARAAEYDAGLVGSRRLME